MRRWIMLIAFLALVLTSGCNRNADPQNVVNLFFNRYHEKNCLDAWGLVHPDREKFKQEFLSLCGQQAEKLDIGQVNVIRDLSDWTDEFGETYQTVAELEIDWREANDQILHLVSTPQGWRLLWSPEHALE